jgi:hypothetical protein
MPALACRQSPRATAHGQILSGESQLNRVDVHIVGGMVRGVAPG